MILALEHLLQPFGLDLSKPTKLARHQDQRYDFAELYRLGQIEEYQSIQGRPAFDGCELLLSFIGQPGTLAKFVGAYAVNGRGELGNWPWSSDFLYPQMENANCFKYNLSPDHRFDLLRERLVIDWGAGTRSWVQALRPQTKPVIEILPSGYIKEFPGFLDFVLYSDELEAIMANPVSNREWHRALASVAGVYMILDSATGLQYIGSAYGEKGILGRWATYATTRHGNNKELKALLSSNPARWQDLRFSILQTLSRTLTAKEIIAYEDLHKRKLGSRAHGLNAN